MMSPATLKPAAPANRSRGGMGRAQWLAKQHGRKAVLYVIRIHGNGPVQHSLSQLRGQGPLNSH